MLNLKDRGAKVLITTEHWGKVVGSIRVSDIKIESEAKYERVVPIDRAVLGGSELITARTGSTLEPSAASLVLFDKNGNVIWSTPK